MNQCHFEARRRRRQLCAAFAASELDATTEPCNALDASQQVQRALALLSETHRETVVLRYVGELRLLEIAEARWSSCARALVPARS